MDGYYDASRPNHENNVHAPELARGGASAPSTPYCCMLLRAAACCCVLLLLPHAPAPATVAAGACAAVVTDANKENFALKTARIQTFGGGTRWCFRGFDGQLANATVWLGGTQICVIDVASRAQFTSSHRCLSLRFHCLALYTTASHTVSLPFIVFPLPFTVFPLPLIVFPLPSTAFHCLSTTFHCVFAALAMPLFMSPHRRPGVVTELTATVDGRWDFRARFSQQSARVLPFCCTPLSL